MAYTKTVWTSETDITPARLDHLETQYDEAVAYTDAHLRSDTSLELRAEVAAAAPIHAVGRIYFNSTTGIFAGSDGSAWISMSEGD
ncbi:MAG: hypothetical protein ACOX8W_12945 [bacterium]